MAHDIEVRGLCKRFGSRIALDRVSFVCPTGNITGYLGPNGAGKSTTSSIALGLAHADEGDVLFQGQRYVQSSSLAQRVGVVLGSSSLPGSMGASKALLRRARCLGVDRSRVDSLVDWVGLDGQADKRIKHLSLGQKQRLKLAMALVSDPEFLVLDEPFNGLDPEGIVWLRELLQDHAMRGGTTLVSSHLIAELQDIIGHVVIIREGKIVLEGNPDDFIEAERTTVEFADANRACAVLDAVGVPWTCSGSLFLVDAPAPVVGELIAEYSLVILEMRSSSGRGLERVYMEHASEKS